MYRLFRWSSTSAVLLSFGLITGAVAPIFISTPASARETQEATPSNENNTIVAIASTNDSFSTLTKALQATGLAEKLQTQGSYTVFAPTDEAFAALPKGILNRLLQPQSRKILTSILSYHIVPKELTTSEIQLGQVKTLEGNNLNLNIRGNKVSANKASVINPDIQASNGVIHGIDEVLIPPNIDLSQLQQPQSLNKQNTENEGKIEVDIEDEDVVVDIRPRLNYIGVGGNIGLGGDSAIGEGSFTVFSKIGLTRNLSTRPAVAIDDDPTILLPLTYDFSSQTVDPIEGGPVDSLTISPYIGAGLGIEASDDADVGALITGGLDIPLSSEVMLNATTNVLFLDDTDVGLMLGVGYRF